MEKPGRLEGRTVFIGDEPIDAEAVIAATGSRPNIPDIKGIDLDGVYTPHTLTRYEKTSQKTCDYRGRRDGC